MNGALIIIPAAMLFLSMFIVTTVGIIMNLPKEDPPKPLEPIEEEERTRYGFARRLIDQQRAWGHGVAAPHGSLRYAAINEADAFTQWFTECVFLPDSPEPEDIILVERWTQSYAKYCGPRGYPLMDNVALLETMAAFAQTNGSGMSVNGDFIDGRLVG